MKLKNKIVITGTMVLMFVSLSCNKDYLDKNPTDQLSNDTFWKNAGEVKMALAGCYSRLYGSFQSYLRGYMDGLGEGHLAYWGFYGFEDNYKMGVISPASGGGKDDLYSSSYRAIAQCNFFLDNVDNATTVDEAVITQSKAEVRFLRALFYFDLVQCFGDVIIYPTSPATPEESKIAKSPKADVYAFIHEDLDFAIANLPDVNYTAGHAVKGSAMGLKARVLITQENWSETTALCQQIMSSGKFSIYEDYEGMFIKRGQKNNPEIMFACDYLGPDLYHSYYGINIEFAKHIFVNRPMEDAFECSDGLPISESPLYDPENVWINRDPRHTYIMRNPVGTDWPDHYKYSEYDITGWQNRKYIDPTVGGNYANNFKNDWNYILIRYADIVLMYAEAKNELSGPDQSVYDAINLVRSRPVPASVFPDLTPLPPIDQTRYNTKELLRAYIQHERFVEFPMEGIRYFDLKRWKIAHIIIPQYQNQAGNSYVFQNPRDYLWPFSTREMDSNPNLVQTTGY
jgi:starch-binding outer membrane protein, SusD/RagB family